MGQLITRWVVKTLSKPFVRILYGGQWMVKSSVAGWNAEPRLKEGTEEEA